MQEHDLGQILGRLQQSEDHSTAFTEEWTQGRSAFGGLAASLASCAMGKLLLTRQPIRSLMVSFIAPLPPSEVRVEPQILRQGKNVTQTSASVISNGSVCLQAMGVFGNPREALRVHPDPQFNPEPRHPAAAIDGTRKGLPAFLRHYEGYWTGGGIPFSGKQDLRLGMWVRHRSDLRDFPVEKIISIADIPPPVILSHYTQPPVQAASLTWSLEFIRDPATIESDWFYLEFLVDHAADGYTQQSGRVFTETGQLCALSRQCMVYFA